MVEVVLPVVFLAALSGLLAALLWARATHGRSPTTGRADRVGTRVFAAVAALLVIGAPIEPVRDALGFGVPEACQQKPHSRPPAMEETADIDALKAELRHRRLENAIAPPGVRARGTSEVARLTGPGSVNRTDDRWNVFGTDLGHPFTYRGRLGLVFGDTFGDEDRNGWRSNVMAWAERTTPDELRFTGMPADDGPARELIGSLKLRGIEQTVIPTYAVGLPDRIVVHYMSIVCWAQAGSWVADHAGLAVSRDGGETFERAPGIRWSGDSGFVQVAFVREGVWTYAFGLPSGRGGPASLARVPTEAITDQSAWRYWDGSDWVDAPGSAAPVVAAPVGELSVQWNQAYDRWVMMYLHEGRGGIVLRTAEELTGPWSAAELVASLVDFPQLYAPYLLPAMGDDQVVHFTMSRYDLYNVFLMRTRLVPAPDLAPVVPY